MRMVSVALFLSLLSVCFAVKAPPSTLDLSLYNRGAGQDFVTSSGFNTSVWTSIINHDGGDDHFWFSKENDTGLFLSTTASSGSSAGFTQVPDDCLHGFGYGVFHYTAKVPLDNVKQGYGINLIMGNADNSRLDPSNDDTISEVDILEASGNVGFSTLHFYAANVSSRDGQIMHYVIDPYSGNYLDLTAWHDYDFMWEKGVMALYIDHKLLYYITGAQVPADGFHGGCHKTLGAQVRVDTKFEYLLSTIQLCLQNVWHYTAR